VNFRGVFALRPSGTLADGSGWLEGTMFRVIRFKLLNFF